MFTELFDITLPLRNNGICYPGDLAFQREIRYSMSDGALCNASAICMSAHSGTHLDAPAHFFTNGLTIDKIDLSSLVLPAVVIGISDPEQVSAEELEGYSLPEGCAVLLKTRNSTENLHESELYYTSYVTLTPEAARLCVDRKVRLVGIDGISADKDGDIDFPVHKTLLGNGILILENIFLRDIHPGRYTLMCLPLKIEDGDGSPARAVLAGKGGCI